MKKAFPYILATAISIIAIFSSFKLADPELGISTALLTWTGCLWIISTSRKNNRCLSR
ncbi:MULTISPECIES: hypothetical protein [unclassified Pedobacter]|uniref:hypothetical protein n=1 Tax=unclassified Pedobacter TaxID=2628915 RepID=UPI001E64E840|nr:MULTISPECIES: hypothetical protein [unclassified Pedobacter]